MSFLKIDCVATFKRETWAQFRTKTRSLLKWTICWFWKGTWQCCRPFLQLLPTNVSFSVSSFFSIRWSFRCWYLHLSVDPQSTSSVAVFVEICYFVTLFTWLLFVRHFVTSFFFQLSFILGRFPSNQSSRFVPFIPVSYFTFFYFTYFSCHQLPPQQVVELLLTSLMASFFFNFGLSFLLGFVFVSHFFVVCVTAPTGHPFGFEFQFKIQWPL